MPGIKPLTLNYCWNFQNRFTHLREKLVQLIIPWKKPAKIEASKRTFWKFKRLSGRFFVRLSGRFENFQKRPLRQIRQYIYLINFWDFILITVVGLQVHCIILKMPPNENLRSTFLWTPKPIINKLCTHKSLNSYFYILLFSDLFS